MNLFEASTGQRTALVYCTTRSSSSITTPTKQKWHGLPGYPVIDGQEMEAVSPRPPVREAHADTSRVCCWMGGVDGLLPRLPNQLNTLNHPPPAFCFWKKRFPRDQDSNPDPSLPEGPALCTVGVDGRHSWNANHYTTSGFNCQTT